LSRLSLLEFTVIAGVGRLLGTVLLSLGGSYLRHHEYKNFITLTGIAIIVMATVWLFKNKIERLLRKWHISRYKKIKDSKKKDSQSSAQNKNENKVLSLFYHLIKALPHVSPAPNAASIT